MPDDSDDYSTRIDNQLSELLPDDPEEVSEGVPTEKKEKMITLLQQAKKELGRSPSYNEFNSLNYEISADVVKWAFGTWNEAKREADLQTYKRGEGKPATTDIKEQYFAELDTPEKAYWLGTLIANSSVKTNKESEYELSIGRVISKEYFIRGFADAVESEYSINQVTPSSRGEQDILMTNITNPIFIQNLLSAGYPDPDGSETQIPSMKSDLRAPFLRGYLESAGYFSTNGWDITMDDEDSALRLQDWIESFGVTRVTVSEYQDRRPHVLVSNVFDIKTLFEKCWPRGVSTEPSSGSYPKQVLDYLQSEYPYPENVEYLSTSD